ncbi:MAG: hypothetical protein IH840_11145 [Candidatus Heimdallarchaeota archaeon]|nr:hypothetical protein [Candidatus Heimdallarchaeota archaeon]
MSLENLSDVDRWSLRQDYRKIELIKCPNCKVYFEPTPSDHCPGCMNDLENVKDRVVGWIKKE